MVWGLAAIVAGHLTSSQAFAAYPSCSDNWGIGFIGSAPPGEIIAGETVSFSVNGLVTDKSYEFSIRRYGYWGYTDPPIVFGSVTGKRTEQLKVGPPKTNTGGNYDILIKDEDDNWCELGEIKILSDNNCQIKLEQAGFKDTFCVDVDSGELLVSAHNIVVEGQLANEPMVFRDAKSSCGLPATRDVQATNGETDQVSYTMDESDIGKTCHLEVLTQASIDSISFSVPVLCSVDFKLIQACDDEDRTKPPSSSIFDLCQQIPKDSEAFAKCARCVAGVDVNGGSTPVSPEVPLGIWTAVGCIKNDPQTIVETAIKIGLSISGGVALLMIMAASFSLSTSQGDAKKTAEAKEMVTSAVVGIIFIIMSVTILEFIGVKIFQIPGFGK